MKYICVYCGSSTGKGEKYLQNAEKLGREMAESGIGLVYGGSSNGTMGALARSCLGSGGKVIGVMPDELLDSIGYTEDLQTGLTEVIRPKTISERKQVMMEKANGFIALPGGLGTLDEVAEAMNEYSVGSHKKPIGLLNTDGYYDHIKAWLDFAQQEGFLYHIKASSFFYEEDPTALLQKLREHMV